MGAFQGSTLVQGAEPLLDSRNPVLEADLKSNRVIIKASLEVSPYGTPCKSILAEAATRWCRLRQQPPESGVIFGNSLFRLLVKVRKLTSRTGGSKQDWLLELKSLIRWAKKGNDHPSGIAPYPGLIQEQGHTNRERLI